MLNVLRDSFKTTPYLKWVLILVGFGLVAYLGNAFSNPGRSGRGDWVARVNGQEITQLEFRQAAGRLDQYYRGLFGDSYEQFAPQLQIRQQALQAVIEKELILQDARRLGLQNSPTDLANQIRNHPSFQDATGRFIGNEQYVDLVNANVSGGVSAFEADLSNDLLSAKWTNFVTQPVSVTDDELETVFRQRTEKTAIDYVIVASADQDVEMKVEEDALRSWYESHLDDYQRGEGRRIRYFVVERDVAGVEVNADQIREYYEANQAGYAHPEQRQVRHILLRLAPDADEAARAAAREQGEELLERLRNGEDFAALARAMSQDPDSAELGGDLGFVSRGAMYESFEQAAFDTPVGELAPLTETPYGIHVIQVTDSREAGVTPLSELEESIRRTVELNTASERATSEAERLRGEITEIAAFDSVAQGAGLVVESRFVANDERIPELGASMEFMAIVGALEAGSVSNPLPVAAGLAIVAVDEVVPPGPAPFEDVRGSVTTDVLNERMREAARAAARQAHERASDLAAAAGKLELEVESSGDLAPGQSLPGIGGTTPDFNAAIFGDAVSVGDSGVIEVPAGALIYQVTGREAFDPVRFESEKAQLRDETLGDRRTRYRQSILNQLRSRETIEINEAWLDALAPATPPTG